MLASLSNGMCFRINAEEAANGSICMCAFRVKEITEQ